MLDCRVRVRFIYKQPFALHCIAFPLLHSFFWRGNPSKKVWRMRNSSLFFYLTSNYRCSKRAGLLNCIAAGYTAVRAAFPHSLVLPSLGNHDTVVMEYDGGQSSAAVFTGSKEMAWLYTAVADLWAKPEATGCTADVHTRKGAQTAAAAAASSPSRSSYSNNFSCAEVRRTLLIGGYFATRRSYPKLNMTIISLNTNYWSLDSNVALRNVSSEAYMLGDGMLEWAKGHLAAAAST